MIVMIMMKNQASFRLLKTKSKVYHLPGKKLAHLGGVLAKSVLKINSLQPILKIHK